MTWMQCDLHLHCRAAGSSQNMVRTNTVGCYLSLILYRAKIWVLVIKVLNRSQNLVRTSPHYINRSQNMVSIACELGTHL